MVRAGRHHRDAGRPEPHRGRHQHAARPRRSREAPRGPPASRRTRPRPVLRRSRPAPSHGPPARHAAAHRRRLGRSRARHRPGGPRLLVRAGLRRQAHRLGRALRPGRPDGRPLRLGLRHPRAGDPALHGQELRRAHQRPLPEPQGPRHRRLAGRGPGHRPHRPRNGPRPPRSAAPEPAGALALFPRLPLGRRHRRPPERGHERPQRLLGLGAGGQPHRRRERQRPGRRLVEPRRRGLRPRRRPGAQHPSPVRRVEPRRARARQVGRGRPRPLPRDAARALRARHPAHGHAAPLHEPALALGPRGLAAPRGGARLRPLRRLRRHGPGRPVRHLVHAQRAGDLRRLRLHPGPLAGRDGPSPLHQGHPPPAPRPRRRLPTRCATVRPNARVGLVQHFAGFEPADPGSRARPPGGRGARHRPQLAAASRRWSPAA